MSINHCPATGEACAFAPAPDDVETNTRMTDVFELCKAAPAENGSKFICGILVSVSHQAIEARTGSGE